MSEKTSPPKVWGLRTPAFFERCEGERITVHLVNGATLQGELTGVDTYDLFLQDGDGAGPLVMVPKHAVLFIALDNGG